MGTRQSKFEPPPTARHTAVAIGDHLYRWGGEDPEQKTTSVDVFDVRREQWECLSSSGVSPPGLWDYAYTALGNSLFTFGGMGDIKGLYLSEEDPVPSPETSVIHQLDTKTMEWKEVVPRNPSKAPRRRGCGMVSLDDDKLVVFAGHTEYGTSTNELNVFDLKEMTWLDQPSTGIEPPFVSAFTFTKIDATRAVVFGGHEHCNNRNYNDVYILDLRTWEWTILDVQGPKPRARYKHAACCLAGPLTGQEHPTLLVTGGLGDIPTTRNPKRLNDVWLLDVDGRRWKKVALPKTILPRYQHTATAFGSGPDCRQLVLWGGKTEWKLVMCEALGMEVWGGEPIGETTLLNFDLTRGKWKVTKVVKRHQLGEPVKRLREKTEKLWPPTRDAGMIASQEERPARAEEEAN